MSLVLLEALTAAEKAILGQNFDSAPLRFLRDKYISWSRLDVFFEPTPTVDSFVVTTALAKTCLIGSPATGKTSLNLYAKSKEFDGAYLPEVGVQIDVLGWKLTVPVVEKYTTAKSQHWVLPCNQVR